MKGHIIIFYAVFSVFLSIFIIACSNNLPKTTINISVRTMEQICANNGLMNEVIDNGIDREVYCIFPDGSSCPALDFQTGTCYDKDKTYLHTLEIYVDRELYVSSFVISIDYNINKVIPIFQDPNASFISGAPSQDIMFTSYVKSPKIIGASANRRSLFFAFYNPSSFMIKNMVVSIPVRTTNSVEDSDFNLTSVSINDDSNQEVGSKKDIILKLN